MTARAEVLDRLDERLSTWAFNHPNWESETSLSVLEFALAAIEEMRGADD